MLNYTTEMYIWNQTGNNNSIMSSMISALEMLCHRTVLCAVSHVHLHDLPMLGKKE